MTSENAEKTFDVTATQYLYDFIQDNISNPYISKQIHEALEIAPPQEKPREVVIEKETSKEENLCPTCKNKLVLIEGCSICIECGYSGCTSG